HNRVRTEIDGKEGTQIAADRPDVALHQDPGVGSDLAGDQEVEIAVAEGERDPSPQAADVDSRLAFVLVEEDPLPFHRHVDFLGGGTGLQDRKSTRLNSSHVK